MNLRLTERLRRSYEAAPKQVQKAFDKQVQFLLPNLHHPSLRAKKFVIGLTRHPKWTVGPTGEPGKFRLSGPAIKRRRTP